jgi:hypothetical protein
MRATQLATLKFFALLFLLPGLGGLIVSAMISTHYLEALPKVPAPEQNRMVPRGIHGITVYQTADEDRNLNIMEYSSVAVFSLGLILGLVYLENWGAAQTSAAEEEEMLQHPG